MGKMHTYSRGVRSVGLAVCCLLTCGAANAGLPDTELNWLGSGRYRMAPIALGASMPPMAETDSRAVEGLPPGAVPGTSTLSWSERVFPDWQTHGKVNAPRVLLAKLAAGRDIAAVNQYLLEAIPWSGAGSDWLLFEGDYDFSLVTLTTILYFFGNDPGRIYPETLRHLLDMLLTEEGDTPLVTSPFTFGLVLDTENHHLMTEGSRYLKNQWLVNHGTAEQRANPVYRNATNGLGDWLSEYLDLMIHEGVYEFNSDPYSGYTLQALLNLEAFPESPFIRRKARYLLDIMNLQYAVGSLDLRRNPPFRRRYEKSDSTVLDDDPHTAYMDAWLRLFRKDALPAGQSEHYTGHALLAELLPYRLPHDVAEWTLNKQTEYFVRMGRGPSACPELYSGGPGYLLSAGGANRGFRSHIVARPITLLLGNGAADIRKCIHLKGNGPWVQWNNTGVYRHFACANGPVHVPATMQATASRAGWRVLDASSAPTLLVAVYEDADLGLIALFPGSTLTPEALLEAILAANPLPDALRTRFMHPDAGLLEYDVNAPKGTWVMKSAGGVTLDRKYDAWPQFEGDLPAVSFAR